ncbi:hypothetical protein EDB85DRAFT_1893542 [Lactarius pseudohatsudake]|nr:hypothetical protein EDB85DRAFT_1893542 [Lactarius pseudohatsudake]
MFTGLQLPLTVPAQPLQDDDTVNIHLLKGQLTVKDQICEYIDCEEPLVTWCFLDYFLSTYNGKMLKERTNNRGRPGNTCVPYQENSGRTGHCRVLRSDGHKTMPYFTGQWFPKHNENDENGLFFALMLALLKPWTSLADIKHEHETFREAFLNFVSGCSDNTLSTIANIEFYHEYCEGARHDNNANDGTGATDDHTNRFSDNFDTVADPQLNDVPIENSFKQPITEQEILTAIDRPFAPPELLHADIAISIGMSCRALSEEQYTVAYHAPAQSATSDHMNLFPHWEQLLNPCNELTLFPSPAKPSYPFMTCPFHSCLL